MTRTVQPLLAVGLLALVFSTACIDGDQPANESRNKHPFGVKVAPDPAGEDVEKYAAQVRLDGGPEDANAQAWVTKATAGKANALDGEWSGRWRFAGDAARWVDQTKPTRIETRGDTVYILFTYWEGEYLIVAKRDAQGKLAGRSVGIQNPKDLGLFVGVIVDGERIDGAWSGPAGSGRWDFRRKTTKE